MLADLLFRLKSLFRRGKMEAELSDEVAFHLEKETQKLIRSGVAPQEAKRRARLAFGFPEYVKEECRDARGTRLVEQFARDVKFAARMLRLNPTFTAVAVASLALGIGANTAIFQLLDAVRLRNLPVPSPEELQMVRIGGEGPTGNFTSRFSHLTYDQWEQIRIQQQAFRSIAAWSPRRFNLASGGEVRPAEGMLVSGAFFGMLEIGVAHGRLLDERDDQRGCGTAAAVISDGFGRREFGGAANAVGRQLRVDGHPFTVVGVTPPGFFGVEVGRSYDVAVPLCAEDQLAGENSQITTHRDQYWLSVIGRLRPGWTTAAATTQLRTASPNIFAATFGKRVGPRERYLKLKLRVLPVGQGLSWLRVNYANVLWLLFGSAALVLLIACGNLANLLLARASARDHELALRVALGASGGRLVRQLLTESLLLALIGSTLGLVLAGAASRALVSFLVTADDPVALDTGMDWRVLLFSLAAALLTCLLFGMAPALRALKMRGTTVPSGMRGTTAARGRSLFRDGLVAAQVALSVVLVAGALLFGRSLFNLLTSDMGFRAEQVMVTSLDIRRLGYDGPRQDVLFRDLLARLRGIPGVTSAAQSTIIPMSGWESNISLQLDDGTSLGTRFSPISSGYFATMGTPILTGRDFVADDLGGTDMAVIVNESFARKAFGGANPVGRTFRSPFESSHLCRIVGLVRNTKYRELQEDFAPILFLAAPQYFAASNYARFVVRSTLPTADLTRAIRETVAGANPAIDIEFARLGIQLRESVARERLLAALSGGFGLLAGLLAAVGLYGVLSYAVAMRRKEIGIRVALGADRPVVVRMVLGHAGLLLGLGVVAGVGLTAAAGRAARALLYGLKPSDPITIALAVILLAAMGLASSYLPARRAARMDPLDALRQE